MAAPTLWAPGIFWLFLQEEHRFVQIIPRFGGGVFRYFLGGGGGKCELYFYGRGDFSEILLSTSMTNHPSKMLNCYRYCCPTASDTPRVMNIRAFLSRTSAQPKNTFFSCAPSDGEKAFGSAHRRNKLRPQKTLGVLSHHPQCDMKSPHLVDL